MGRSLNPPPADVYVSTDMKIYRQVGVRWTKDRRGQRVASKIRQSLGGKSQFTVAQIATMLDLLRTYVVLLPIAHPSGLSPSDCEASMVYHTHIPIKHQETLC